ncbi:unnamed protein product [Moneuplotes crassus]|uniref:Uncharacterized protein n=1 Tax=Euplotes crassus TaxID=5936 RepID=A0AAD1XCR4_EUPCR|nr:unnamed protein product [Moneuplotes crassus]
MDQAFEHIEDFSGGRIDYITAKFTEIIENIVNRETKLYQCCHKDMHISEFLKRCRVKKRHCKYTKVNNSEGKVCPSRP